MELSSDLIARFIKATKDTSDQQENPNLYGTAVEYNGRMWVRLDGSDLLTPVTSTVDTEDGDRVTVAINNHTAVVTGNVSSPSARTDDVQDVANTVTEFGIVLADKATIGQLQVEQARINELVADNVTIKGDLTAAEAKIEDLTAENVEITGTLEAKSAEIENLKTSKLDAETANLTYATIENLNATNAEVYNLKSTYGDFQVLVTNKFTASDALILELQTKKLDADSADIKYANIDFANITEAAVTKIFSESGIIKDLVTQDGHITGELVGVTIKGDLIEGNTIKADKLVVLGENGLYYKLNVNALGEATASSDEKYQNGLDGSVIVAKSITADRVNVTDLVAFGATIGGFHIGENSIYSGVKSSVDNTTKGIYLDTNGQFAVGDSNNYIKYFKDTDDSYKLDISAGAIKMSASSKNLEEELEDIREEVTTFLYIESSRGTVFKNNNVSTLLSVVIYRGADRITDMDTLKSVMGQNVYLQWKWQRMDEEEYGIISASDPRIGNDGFTFLLTPDDVDTKVTFLCELMN